MPIFEKFIKLIQDYHLFERGERVLVGVSGGADSVALLHLLLGIRRRYDLDVIVGHFNHRLRGKESDGDEEFVRELARQLDLACVIEGASAADQSLLRAGVEAWARDRRYEFFTRVSRIHRIAKVALGHTMDDQAETVLLRLVRGAGTLGLAGIPCVREGHFVRPLIRIRRHDILRFLAQQQLSYREDSSNTEEKYLRNRVRRELVPLLREKYNPRIVELLSNTANILRDDIETRTCWMIETFQREAAVTPRGVAWDLGQFGRLPKGLQKDLIRYSLSRINGNLDSISARNVDQILDLARDHKSGRFLEIHKIRITREYQQLHLERIRMPREAGTSYRYRLQIPGEMKLAEAQSIFQASLDEDLNGGYFVQRWEFYLSADEVQSGLWIRNWQAGDAYRPVGTSRVKKIKELFAQKKIPRHLRSAWPVVVIDDKIIFVKGFPVSADRGVKEANRTHLKVVIEERKFDSETGSNLVHRRANS